MIFDCLNAYGFDEHINKETRYRSLDKLGL